jgi:hypothetical protein
MTHPRAKVIISYSRDNIDFAKQLVGARRLLVEDYSDTMKKDSYEANDPAAILHGILRHSASVKRICGLPEAVSWPFKMVSEMNLAASRARTRLSCR